jgi:hypothetical protein
LENSPRRRRFSTATPVRRGGRSEMLEIYKTEGQA